MCGCKDHHRTITTRRDPQSHEPASVKCLSCGDEWTCVPRNSGPAAQQGALF